MSKDDKIRVLLNLLEKKRDLYTDLEYSYIKYYFQSNEFLIDENIDEGIRELVDEAGLLPKEENIYDYFTDFITDRYDVEGKKIIEVGGGVFARLSKRLSLKQKNGIITVYDPRLDPTLEATNKFILKRDRFSVDTDIKDTDLLVGLMPCEGANSLVAQALRKDRDFILWLCEGGPHGDMFDFYEDAENWMKSLIYYTRMELEQRGKTLTLKKEDRFAPYPIITNV